MRLLVATTCCTLWTACSDAANPAKPVPQEPRGPALVEHDFGVIPHPEKREHDFVLDVSNLGGRFIPLRAHLDCSCGHADLRIRGADGTERGLDGSPNPANVVGPDERLIVHVVIDTVTKEAVDVPKTASRGHVVLQPADDRTGGRRIQWPLLLHYGIDSPVVVQPFAAIDFGRVPRSATPEIRTSIRGDERHAAMKFLRVSSSDDDIQATLEPTGDHVRLVVRCRPRDLGSHRALVSVETDAASGFRVNLAVTWKVVPDLEATPMAKVSFRADLSRPQTADEAIGQFVVLTDHDPRRPPEFAVHEFVDDAGQDAAGSFAVDLQPIPGQPRQHRLTVRYAGGRTEAFRGRLVLTKHGADGPFLPIEIAVFPTRTP